VEKHKNAEFNISINFEFSTATPAHSYIITEFVEK
jgi:hypothetical protein